MNFQLITTLFRNRDLFGRRRNRGAMWMSLLGLGISLAAFLFRRNGNKNNLMQNFKQQNNLPNVASALTNEFSNELKPNQNAFNAKKN